MSTSFFGVPTGSKAYAGQGLSIQGLQEAQKRNERRLIGMKPGGIRGAAVQMGAARFHARLLDFTPVDTGSLRASRRITFNASVPRAQIFTSSVAYNPRSRTPPHVYDIFLHAKGGRGLVAGTFKASFPHTMRIVGPKILDDMTDMIAKEIRNP